MKKLLFAVAILSVTNAFALIGGTLVDTETSSPIFHIAALEQGAEEADVCTATKIGYRTILTAAHCVDSKKPFHFLVNFNDSNPQFDMEPVSVQKIHIHPSYKLKADTNDFDLSDIAVVVLKSSQIDSLPSINIDLEVNFSQKLEIWGFGCSNSNGDLAEYFPQKRKAVVQTVSASRITNLKGSQAPIVKAGLKSIKEFSIVTKGVGQDSTSASVCFGDSGGPVIDIKTGKIVAVNAEGLFNDLNDNGESLSGISSYNLHTKISKVKDWFLGLTLPKEK